MGGGGINPSNFFFEIVKKCKGLPMFFMEQNLVLRVY